MEAIRLTRPKLFAATLLIDAIFHAFSLASSFSRATKYMYMCCLYIRIRIFQRGIAVEPFPEYKGECINKDAGSLHPSPVCFSPWPSVTSSVGRSIRGIINDGRDERCGKVISKIIAPGGGNFRVNRRPR